MSDDDDDRIPTAAEVASALGKVLELIQYLNRNADGFLAEGDRVEARKFHKRAEQISVAIAGRDLTAIRKLTSSAPLLKEEQIPNPVLDPLGYGWSVKGF